MEKQNEWTKEVIDFVQKTLSSHAIHVSYIKDTGGYIAAGLIVDDITYTPPLFWRVNRITVSERLYVDVDINSGDLFKLMEV
jgi:hypothetical protein